jgi:receptor-type tyrosine-protein phosphatase gamma
LKIKCDQYWPDEDYEIYGNIQVTHLQSISLAFYTKRIFSVKIVNNSNSKACNLIKKFNHLHSNNNNNLEMIVYQYHFTDWPDHGVPIYILPVLTFIKKSSRSNPEHGGPIVVHCSAGVGRTGTYIVIDAMMKQIQHKTSINVHNFLKHIRNQRNYLVQTEEQFIFIYDVLLESIKSGETDLTEQNYKLYISNLSRVLSTDGLMLIDRQFQLITEFKPNEYQVSTALMPFNMGKNRNANILSVNNSRVGGVMMMDINEDYINATYLHGCSRQNEFIITQYPLEETKLRFWKMVWENNSNQIVVLNSDDAQLNMEPLDPYWLPIGETLNCDCFTVVLKEENFDMDFVIRDFWLQSIDEDYEFSCKMICASYWPDSCTPIKAAFELVNKVKMFRMQTIAQIKQHQAVNNQHKQQQHLIHNDINGYISLSTSNNASVIPPIIVHDLYGGHRAATFCALYTLQDLIKLENSVNVYELAQLYHLKRPGIWINKVCLRKFIKNIYL